MRFIVILLCLLLMLGGGAVAGAQYAPIDLSTIDFLKQAFAKVPGSQEFLKTPMALYTGGGAAGLGFLLIIIAAVTGGKKEPRERPVVKPPAMAPNPPIKAKAPKAAKAVPPKADPAPPAAVAPPISATPKPPPKQPAAAPPPPPQPAPVARAAQPSAKPQASAQPPAEAVGSPPPDPRIVNRKRVQDLVTINDALKAYHAKTGAFPQAAALAGLNERGANWIPGLMPDYLKDIPRDPMHGATTQYVYVSDGANYKLLAVGVSLVNSPNVEVLGIKVDPTRNPTVENASFGFWTPGFAAA